MVESVAAMIDFYKQFIGPDDLVFDVGANLGEVTEVFAGIAGKVVALEPVPESFAVLRNKFSSLSGRLELRRVAVGQKMELGTIFTSESAPTIGAASMALNWIDAVSRTNRFGPGNRWDRPINIEVTTLDDLIREYGIPAFIKIDVEGYELEVLKGLSRPVKALSFEFTPERRDEAALCVLRCRTLGFTKYNLSIMQEFQLGEWTDAAGIIPRLDEHKDSTTVYGDVYAKM